jgi:hypothetical protein
MTVAVANTGNNTLFYLRDRVDEMATAMSTKVVTTNSNTATGNAAITGTFTAGKLVANTLDISGGGSVSVANLTANSITIDVGAFSNLTSNIFTATTANIVNLTSNNITVANLIANAFTVSTLTLTSLTGNAATFNYLTVNTLGAFANITANNIRTNSLSVGNSTVNTVFSAANAAAAANGSFWQNANGAWAYIAPPGGVPGSNTQVLFNDQGVIGTSAAMTFNKVTNILAVNNAFQAPVLATNTAIIQSTQVLLAGTSQQVVDAVPIGYRGTEYICILKDMNANNFGMAKVLALHAGASGAALAVEYGATSSNSAMGIWDASVNATHLALLFTPVSSSVTVTVHKTSLVG